MFSSFSTAADEFVKNEDGYGKKKHSRRELRLNDRNFRSILNEASNSTEGSPTGIKPKGAIFVKEYHLKGSQIVFTRCQAESVSKATVEQASFREPFSSKPIIPT